VEILHHRQPSSAPNAADLCRPLQRSRRALPRFLRAEHRGEAVGTMQSGWPVGWGAAALLATLFFSVFSQDVAWRALFFVGLTPALLVFYVRRYVKEPPVFAETQKNLTAAGKKANFLEIFSPSMLRTTILTCLLSTGAQGGIYAITTWLPTFLRTERKLTVLGTGGYLAVIIVGSLSAVLSALGSATE
jgi:MFS family permease